MERKIILEQMADFFEKVERAPITRTPSEVNLDFENIEFNSLDGLKLKAWYIPAKNSNKIVIFNHFMLANRAGAEPREDWGNIVVDFLPIYKHLVNAGYTVFTYDLRNHGESDIENNGKLGLTNTECLDAVASIRFIKEKYKNKKIYLYSQCYGAVSTIKAMDKYPNDFKDIKAFVNVQPLTLDSYVTGVSKKMKIEDLSNIDIFSNRLKAKTGYSVEDTATLSKAVKIPTLTLQVKNDWRTTQESIEKIHSDISTKDKTLIWIENEEERLQGYNYFAHNPKELVDWLNKY